LGAFIVFEGCDGAGKSTQARILHKRLSRQGFSVRLTHEPGGTSLGEVVRRRLKSRSGLAPMTELLLFAAARAELVQKVIVPELGSGEIVICDRFTASTVAYQGHGRGMDLGLIDGLNETAAPGLRPDLTVLVDVPVEVGLARKKSGLNDTNDTFESEGAEFHQRVREGYISLVAQDPGVWFVVDGTMDKRVTAAAIWERVQPLLGAGGG